MRLIADDVFLFVGYVRRANFTAPYAGNGCNQGFIGFRVGARDGGEERQSETDDKDDLTNQYTSSNV